MLRKKYHVVRKKYHVVRKIFYVASIFSGAAGRKSGVRAGEKDAVEESSHGGPLERRRGSSSTASLFNAFTERYVAGR